MEIEFRVSDYQFRLYTVCNWKAKEGYVDVLGLPAWQGWKPVNG